MLKAAGLSGLAVAGIGLAGCSAASTSAAAASSSPPAASGKGFLVWATHVYYNQPALVGIPVGFHDFLDLVGWKFQVTAARTSDDVQQTIQAQQEALQLKPDAIVATMTDPTSFNASLKAIINAGIYLQLNNTQPDTGNPFGVPFIGQNFTNAAIASVTTVMDAAVAKGHKQGPILLGYCCGNQGAVGTRTSGLLAGIRQYNKAHGTNFTSVQLLDASDTDPASALGVWQAKLRQVGHQIVGMVCDQVGDPSITAAKSIGLAPGFVPAVTFDVTDQRLQYVDDGWFIAVVDQQPYAQGYVAAAQAYMWLQSKTNPVLDYDTGSDLITKTGLAAKRESDAYIAKRASELGLNL
jgi:ABC-type sugar transport system substrate-binding protein